MLVLLLLYPIVFLFGTFVHDPLFARLGELPFPVALFLSNVASIVLLNYLVPWASKRFSWWLAPSATGVGRVNLGGWALLAALCVLMVIIFTWLF